MQNANGNWSANHFNTFFWIETTLSEEMNKCKLALLTSVDSKGVK